MAAASTNLNLGTNSWNNMLPSSGSVFSAYASVSATITLLQQGYRQFIPELIRDRIARLLPRLLFRRSNTKFTLLVEEYQGINRNPLYEALQAYLCDKVLTTSACYLKATTEGSTPSERAAAISLQLTQEEVHKDVFGGIEIHWTFFCGDRPTVRQKPRYNWDSEEGESKMTVDDIQLRYFHLSFLKTHKDFFFSTYIPQVLKVADEIMSREKILKIWTLKYTGSTYNKAARWESVKLNHPSTFDSLALEPDLKKSIIEDLNLFLERKEFYRKVGRAWKRGYLLYGPPGTGKSSLIAAIANYLKFDVYDLQLMHIDGDDMLRKLLLSTTNRSILVIEDIDCSMGLPVKRKDVDQDESESEDEEESHVRSKPGVKETKISLSGLLNFIDGLWSSCGDERIIIFTTNHKERIDPALLRPGRMDVHVHMSYLGMPAFKILSSNYLDIPADSLSSHPLIEDIDCMIRTTHVTAAEVAGELMKSKNLDTVLHGVVGLLKRKRTEKELEQCEKERAKKARKAKKEEMAKKKELVKALIDKT